MLKLSGHETIMINFLTRKAFFRRLSQMSDITLVSGSCLKHNTDINILYT